MASLVRPTRPYLLPAEPEIVNKDGKPHVRVRENGKPVLHPLTRDGAKYLKRSTKWYGKFRDAAGVVRVVPLSPNKDAARLMLAELVKKAENEKLGIRDPFEKHRKKTLADHLANWQESLRAGGRNETYVALKLGRVRSAVEGCGWTLPGDMTADRLETFLADLRQQSPALPPLPADVEWFAVREVGALLGGVTRHHVAYLVRENKLTGRGRGKARRFSRATVEALRRLKDRGRRRPRTTTCKRSTSSPGGWPTTAGSSAARSPG